MNTCRISPLVVWCALLTLSACNNSSPDGSEKSAGAPGAYVVHNLVSSVQGKADHLDPLLKNPWGMVFNPAGPVWIANNATNTSTLYDGAGVQTPLIVLIPAGGSPPANLTGASAPTGIVFNGTKDFAVSVMGQAPTPSNFIFSGEGGTIAGWALMVNPLLTVTMYDGSAAGAVYKGLAIASNGSANFLYATDFHNHTVDVFDKNFAKVSSAGGFKDPSLPPDFSPFGIQAINDRVYVTYAQKSASSDDEGDGAGLGYVDVFDADGNLIQQLVAGGALNAPWGIALAPADFGSFGNDLLIGNFGDGAINAYDPGTGKFAGTLSAADGTPIQIPGLWGFAFGNGLMSQAANALYFTAGINGEADGLYGSIAAAP